MGGDLISACACEADPAYTACVLDAYSWNLPDKQMGGTPSITNYIVEFGAGVGGDSIQLILRRGGAEISGEPDHASIHLANTVTNPAGKLPIADCTGSTNGRPGV